MNNNCLFIILFPLLMFVEMNVLERMIPPYKNGVRIGHREAILFALVNIALIMLISFLFEYFFT